MRSILRNTLILCSLMLMGWGFTACSNTDEPTPVVPEMTAVGQATSWDTATVTVSTKSISEWAWMVLPSTEQVPSETIIFKDGTVVAGQDGETTLSIDGLERLTDYSFYAAAKYMDGKVEKFLEEIVTTEFTTLDFSDEITITKVKVDGFDMHIKVPESVKAGTSVLKWGVQNIVMYNSNKAGWFGPTADARMLCLNDEAYPAAILTDDTTLHVDEDHRYAKDENGDYIIDEWSGEYTYYWDFIAPGEPLVFLASEFGWGESDWGWGEGWYLMPFDEMGFSDDYSNAMWEGGELPNEEDYWTDGAYHKKIELTTLPPAELDAQVHIDAGSLAPNGGIVKITHDEGVYCYSLAILDHATYVDMLDNYLGGDESLLQWYTTSYYGMMSGFMTIFTDEIDEYYGGVLEANLADFLWDMAPGSAIHIIATAMGGKETEDGMEADQMKQSFTHFTCELPDYSMDAPEIVVTGLEPTSAYKVGYNVKCVNWQDAPAAEVAYAFNYVREFNLELSYGSTYEELVSGNRYYAYFSEDEIAQVNSDGGCNVYFDVRENSTSRLAVMAWNAEGRSSTFEGENPSAVADASSARIPDADPIASPYYEDLKGEWTATATIYKQAYGDPDGDGKYGYYDRVQEVKTKVTIGDVTCPESLTQDIYDLYEENGVSKEMTDAYFAELKTSVNDFNASVRGQNRILCTGWGFDFYMVDGEDSPLELATPWDLFIHPEYNASYVEPLLYEFGPKWFLQVAEDGSLFVPVNVNRVAPVTQWASSRGYFLAGANKDENMANYAPADEADLDNVEAWPNLPVEVSEDKQTITIKSYTLNDVVYYPNLVYESWGSMYINDTKIISEVVLTKGWSGDETPANVEAASKATVAEGTKVVNGGKVNIVAPKAHTPFAGVKKVAAKRLEGKAVTFEQMNERIQKFHSEMLKTRK